MAESPGIAINVQAFLPGTVHLSATEVGAYYLLLRHSRMFPGYAIPAGNKQLARVARATASQWRSVRPAVADFFFEESGKWVHKPHFEKLFVWHPVRSISPSLRQRVFKRDNWTCVYCGSTEDLCADHIFPRLYGGQNAFKNLQTLCRPCNSSKGASLPEGYGE